tara:strand:+ start:29 stop:289 length:261 start_codon:yes stop_codon:yes gene_type:complete
MNDQLRQAYDIDNRRAGTYTERAGQPISATDNERAKKFLAEFTARGRSEQEPNLSVERSQEGRFVIDIGGSFPSSKVGFRNSFRAR